MTDDKIALRALLEKGCACRASLRPTPLHRAPWRRTLSKAVYIPGEHVMLYPAVLAPVRTAYQQGSCCQW